MATTLVLALLVGLQDGAPPDSEILQRGQLPANAELANSPGLAALAVAHQARGSFVSPPELSPGSWVVDLRSLSFDAYLILRDPQGAILAENDDGAGSTHARLSLEIHGSASLPQLQVVSLSGDGGPFALIWRPAPLPDPTSPEGRQLTVADATTMLELWRQNDGENPETGRLAWNDLALAHWAAGDLDRAESAAQESLTMALAAFGEDHPATAQAYNQLAACLLQRGKASAAIEKFQAALRLRQRHLGEENWDTATTHQNLAIALESSGDPTAAVEHFQRAYLIRAALQSPHGQAALQSLQGMANGAKQASLPEKVLWAHTRLLEAAQVLLGPDHIECGRNLIRIGNAQMKLGRYPEAIESYRRALPIESKHPSGPTDYLSLLLDNLGECQRLLGDPLGALQHYQEALAIQHRLPTAEPGTRAVIVLHQALAKQDLGRFDSARRSAEQGLAELVATLGDDHPLIGYGLGVVAEIVAKQGLFEECLDLHQQILNRYQRTLREGRFASTPRFNSLIQLATSPERRQQVLPLVTDLYQTDLRTFGSDHPRTLRSRSSMASLLLANDEYEPAQALLEENLAARIRTFGEQDSNTAIAMNNLAILWRRQGQFDASVEWYRKAIKIWENTLGSDHPDLAVGRLNLALVLRDQGKQESALAELRNAHALFSAANGEDHPTTTDCLRQIGLTLGLTHHPLAASETLGRALQLALHRLDREFPMMSEAARLRTLSLGANPEDYLASLFALEESPPLQEAYALFLQWKGKATRVQAAGQQLARHTDDPRIRQQREALRRLSSALASALRDPRGTASPEKQQQVKDLIAERLTAERTLNQLLEEEIGLTSLLQVPPPEEVQAALPENGVLIDFFVGKQIYAWVIPPTGPVRLYALGGSVEPQRAQSQWLTSSRIRGGRSDDALDLDQAAKTLALMWAKLAEGVGDAEVVFISPDGFLGEMPFGILSSDVKHHLLEAHRFVYLDDPTSLIREPNQGPHPSSSTVLLVGDVDYSHTPALAAGRWPPLPGSSAEIAAVAQVGATQSVHRLTGLNANEASVRTALEGAEIAHLATHGYFEQGLDSGEELLPGLRSGLVFARDPGVSTRRIQDDGLLTAEEIQGLNLHQCRLAVLSACETGLGVRHSGEGMQSMRRAFTIAGAETVISSLWKVDDQATATLMVDFYTNLWRHGMSRLEALHQAKLSMLQRNRKLFDGDSRPSTWGAFVLSGSWD